MNSFLETSKPFESFGRKMEPFLGELYPNMLDNNIHSISIGRNKDAQAGQRGSYRITGMDSKINGNYLETPDKILSTERIANKEVAGVETFTKRVSDSAKEVILRQKQQLIDNGMSEVEAEKRVRDGLTIIGHYDKEIRKYVAEPLVGRTKDAMMSGMTVPYWDVSYTTRVFKQPFIQGIARNLVDVMGIPNIWADALVMYAETFEGYARISGVAKTSGEHNDSAPVRNRFEMLVSEFVNLVVDYETGFHESIVAGQPGNFLTPMGIGDRERYARLMLEQITNAMWLFGAPEAGFDGLSQIVAEDAFAGDSLTNIWTANGTTMGALAVKSLLRLLGDAQEAINFMASSVRINVSPAAYKVLKWSMQSDVYNPSNPLTIIADNFKDTMVLQSNEFGKGVDKYTLVSDPFCAPNTPWNAHATDLMFITFPTIKSALDPQEGVVIAPVAIENFVLPAFPQRDGLTRTMLRRIGSIIAPITGTVKIVRGFGV